MTHLDLFSGIGGFALAARWAGIETIAFSEVDKYAVRVLNKNFPGVPNLGDVTKYEEWPELGPIDLCTGGFPCQPFSCAGKRRGSKDDRHLWPAMCAVVQRYQPTWIIGENVPGIIPMELDSVLADMESLGYTCQTFVIPACAVDARHRRSRIWVMARNANKRDVSEEQQMEGYGESNDPSRICETIPDSPSERHTSSSQIDVFGIESGSRWLPEPGVGRVAHGVPNRIHRLKGLGNSIVPQVAYELIAMIKSIHEVVE